MADKEEDLGLDLKEIEREIEDLETIYLETTGNKGNLLQGFGRYLIHRTMKYNKKPPKIDVHNHQRLFSLSSCTSRLSQALGDSIERFSMQQTQQKQSDSQDAYGKRISSQESKAEDLFNDSESFSSSNYERYEHRTPTIRRPKKIFKTRKQQ